MIQRNKQPCQQSGNDAENHFAGAGNMVALGSGSQRKIADYQLSRFACYLIAQNGDPRKPEIALAQKYFAIQTRRKEEMMTSELGRACFVSNSLEFVGIFTGTQTKKVASTFDATFKIWSRRHPNGIDSLAQTLAYSGWVELLSTSKDTYKIHQVPENCK